MLTICPTADYELFFGRNHLPPEEVLFEPTSKLLEVWAEFDIKGTLFPDICSVWRHRELGISGYAEAFEAQIKDAAASGHDIQLHLHPEWRFANFSDGAWHFKSGTQSLHDLGFSPDDPDGAPTLIRKGIRYLEELVRGNDPHYRCMAFRAGGWIIQPEEALFSTLLSEGIRVDASVIPGMKSGRTDYVIDFRAVPDKPMWFISPGEGIGVASGRHQDLLEIPIASYRGHFPLWQHVVNQLRLRRRAKSTPEEIRGYPITKSGPQANHVQRIKNKFEKLMIPRVLDIADTHESMLATLRSYLRRYECQNNDFAICFNGHPKDTYDYHLEELRRFLNIIKRQYNDVVSFQSIAGYVGRVPPVREGASARP
jgi:hypothetical protein